MNKERRNDLSKIIDLIESLKTKFAKLHDEMEELAGKVDDVRSMEEDAYENMPDGLKNSDRGEVAQQAIDAMQSAQDSLLELADAFDESNLDNIITSLDDARGQ